MSFRCPACGREFDVTLFEFSREVVCPCGEKLSLKKGHELWRRPRGGLRKIDWDSLEKEIFGAVNARQRELDHARAKEIRDAADRISTMILQKDMPRVDIEIEIRKLRAFVLEQFPEKEELFRAIYVGRFVRLWNQFRKGEGPLFGPEGKVK